MQMRLLACAFAVSVAAVSGCYVEPSQDAQNGRAEVAGTPVKPRAAEPRGGECHFSPERGCFDAFLSSRRALNVAGRTFFNADDLAARFKELVVKTEAGDLKNDSEQTLEISLVSPLDQASFITGFEFELMGTTKRSGRVRANGILSLNDLTPGTYDVRLSRLIRYQTRLKTEHADETKTKTSCAILFSDMTLEIQSGQRSWENIGDFQLQIIGPTCGVGGV